MASPLGKRSNIDDFDDDLEEFRLPRDSEITGYVDFEENVQARMDQHIPEDNIGYRLLLKMGWKAGQGLGSLGQGRVDPIRIDIKEDSLGVGKAEEEEAYHASSTAKRKALDSEKQLEETEEERLQRERRVEKKQMIERELEEVKRAFYCEICDKQYNKISEYEQHLQSYDHHHKKRFKDMKEQSKKSPFAQSAKDKKRERERKREERELKRMQEAMLKRAANSSASGTATSKPTPSSASSGFMQPRSYTSSTGEWATVVEPSQPVSSAEPSISLGDKKGESQASTQGGWTTVESSPSTIKGDNAISSSSVQPNSGDTNKQSSTEEDKPKTKFAFGLPAKKPAGFQFGLKKK